MTIDTEEYFERIRNSSQTFKNPRRTVQRKPTLKGNGAPHFSSIRKADKESILLKYIKVVDDNLEINLFGFQRALAQLKLPNFIQNIFPQGAAPNNISVPLSASVRSLPTMLAKTQAPPTFQQILTNQWRGWVSGGWKASLKVGGISAIIGGVTGLLDELFARIFKGKYAWLGNILRKGMMAGMFIASVIFLVVAAIGVITAGGAGLVPLIMTTLISCVLGLVGFVCGKLLVKLIYWVMEDVFKFKLHFCNDECNVCVDRTRLIINIDVVVEPEVIEPIAVKPEVNDIHECGENGYFYVGKCFVCYDEKATCGFLHDEDNVAHLCLCKTCSESVDLLNQEKCYCGALNLKINQETAYVEIDNLDTDSKCDSCIFFGRCRKRGDNGPCPSTINTIVFCRNDYSESGRIDYCETHAIKKCKTSYWEYRKFFKGYDGDCE